MIFNVSPNLQFASEKIKYIYITSIGKMWLTFNIMLIPRDWWISSSLVITWAATENVSMLVRMWKWQRGKFVRKGKHRQEKTKKIKSLNSSYSKALWVDIKYSIASFIYLQYFALSKKNILFCFDAFIRFRKYTK